MSSLAGPSSYSSFSVRPQQPPAISTKLRRVVDVESTPPSAVTSATAPPTPIARAQSIAETEGRESLDRQLNGHAQRADDRNGNGERNGERRRPQDVKASISPDLDAVRARATAWSRKHGRTIEEETAMVQTAIG